MKKKRLSPAIPPLIHPPRLALVRKPPCEPCNAHRGNDESVQPHESLLPIGKLSLENGRYDMLYSCAACSRQWIRERGPGGKGWL